MITYPIRQRNHNYIDPKILPWVDLHFPADSSYNGRVFLGIRKRTKKGDIFRNLSRRNIDELRPFIPKMHISRARDYYITANSMTGVERANDQVFALHNIVIDVDLHDEDINHYEEATAFIWRCKRDLWSDGSCPVPNSIVFTGRGVQIWWAIEPISVKFLPSYTHLLSWLVDQLKGVLDEYTEELRLHKIDRSTSIRTAGWFRLPLTYNTVTNTLGKLEILNKTRYALLDTIGQYVPASYRPSYAKGRISLLNAPMQIYKGVAMPVGFAPLADNDRAVIKGCSSALTKRALTMAKLRAIRNKPIGSEERDHFNLIVFCILLGEFGTEESFKRTLLFNSGFKEPMPVEEVEKILATAMEKQYKLSNEKIIEILDIKQDEQQELQFFAVSRRSKKLKPNHSRDTNSKMAKKDRDTKIIALFESGVNKSCISRMLSISRNTVIAVIKRFSSKQGETPCQTSEDAETAPTASQSPTKSSDNNRHETQKNAPSGVRKNRSYKYVSYKEKVLRTNTNGTMHSLTPVNQPRGKQIDNSSDRTTGRRALIWAGGILLSPDDS